MPENPSASIIILTYNNLEYTRMCLESIFAKTQIPDFEVIVVDNHSTDGTREYLQEVAPKRPNLHPILNETNEGFARGNNIGAAAARGDYLVFLNNDTIVTPGWLGKLILHLQDPSVGLVGPVTNSSGNQTCIEVDYDDPQGIDPFAETYTSAHAGQSFDIPMLPFLCVGVRREVFEEIGPLDERFGLGMFEDDDYALRIKEKGYRILCAEDVFVHHWGSASFSRIGFADYWRTFQENRDKFEAKWSKSWTAPRQRDELLDRQLTQLVDEIARLAFQVIERDQVIAEINKELAEAYNQIKVLRTLRRIRLALAPQGSFQERVTLAGIRLALGLYRSVLQWREKVSATRLIQYLRRLIAFVLPGPLKGFYKELWKEYPFKDRSEVHLYADAHTLPDYSPRVDIGKFADLELPLKITLISTFFNETATVRDWLESLLSQSHPPDEVILVDGGSTDDTVEIIESFAQARSLSIRVVSAPGANIARGRNIAIQEASHPVVACTDFGCHLDKDWLRNLVLPFQIDEDILLSAGHYQVAGDSVLDRLTSHLLMKDLAGIDPQSFLPSSRSLAMKKTFWLKSGGYPEWLTDAGEDTLFDFQAKSQTARWAFVPNAKVYWRAPGTLPKLFKTFYRYARGDGEAGLFSPHYRAMGARFALKTLYRLALLVAILLSIVIPGWWTIPFLTALVLLSVMSFIWRNRVLAGKLGTGFYPFTIVTDLLGMVQVAGFMAGVANRSGVRERKQAFFWQQCQDILERHPDRKGVIVYPPTHDWGFMFQRPHQIARAFAKKGYLFFYGTNNESTDAVIGFQEVEPGLYLAHVPLETFEHIQKPIVYLGSAWHRSTLPVFDQPRVIYDHYDDLEISSARPADHEALLREADLVLVTSRILQTKVTELRPDGLLIPNGVDYDLIKNQQPQPDQAVPEDWKELIKMRRSVIGYSGALAEWVDYDLLAFLAKSRPDLELALVGVDYDGSLGRSELLKLENVHWLGLKPFQDLFQYVWRFDVGIIPFKINKITLATSPIKLFEYMACELPIVTTPLPECKLYPEVLVAETAEQFLARISEALRLRGDPGYLATLNARAAANTWDGRVETILSHLEKDSRA